MPWWVVRLEVSFHVRFCKGQGFLTKLHTFRKHEASNGKSKRLLMENRAQDRNSGVSLCNHDSHATRRFGGDGPSARRRFRCLTLQVVRVPLVPLVLPVSQVSGVPGALGAQFMALKLHFLRAWCMVLVPGARSGCPSVQSLHCSGCSWSLPCTHFLLPLVPGCSASAPRL